MTGDISIHCLWESIKLSAERAMGEVMREAGCGSATVKPEQSSLLHRNKPLPTFIKNLRLLSHLPFVLLGFSKKEREQAWWQGTFARHWESREGWEKQVYELNALSLQNLYVEILNPKVTVSGSEALKRLSQSIAFMNRMNACDD